MKDTVRKSAPSNQISFRLYVKSYRYRWLIDFYSKVYTWLINLLPKHYYIIRIPRGKHERNSDYTLLHCFPVLESLIKFPRTALWKSSHHFCITIVLKLEFCIVSLPPPNIWPWTLNGGDFCDFFFLFCFVLFFSVQGNIWEWLHVVIAHRLQM